MGRDLDRDSRINPRYGAGGKKNLLIMRRAPVSVRAPSRPVIYVGPRRVSRAEVR